MLCLADQIGSHNEGVGGRVGKDQAVGWACDHVDANPTKECAFGFGDKLVSGAHDDVRLRLTEQTKGHRGNGLNTANRHDLVGTTDMRRIGNRRRNPLARLWRRADRDVPTTCDLGGCHGHDRTGDVPVTARRNIAACCINRYCLLTGCHPRHDLVFDIRDR